jgi:hypothetical protein
MSEDQRKILDMLSEGKISVDEAEKLLEALKQGDPGQTEGPSRGSIGWKYLRVLVEPGPNSQSKDRVNIRVPMKLIRAGMKWAAFIPKHAQSSVNKALHDKGIDVDFGKMTPKDIEELVSNLDELTVDVEGSEKVKIFCE